MKQERTGTTKQGKKGERTGKEEQGGAGGVLRNFTIAIAAPLPPRQGALFRLPTVIDS